jgi:hypothetical protein
MGINILGLVGIQPNFHGGIVKEMEALSST